MIFLYVPFFYFIASLFTALLIILINLTTNLIWLMSQGFDISVIMFFELFLKDILNGLLFLIVIFWKKIDEFILNKLGFKTYKIASGIIIVALIILAWLLYD